MLTFTVAILLLPESVKWLGATVIAMECTLFSCFVGLPPERVTFAAELSKVTRMHAPYAITVQQYVLQQQYYTQYCVH